MKKAEAKEEGSLLKPMWFIKANLALAFSSACLEVILFPPPFIQQFF